MLLALQAREMMGVAKKLLQIVKTTGQLDARGRKPGSTAKAPSSAAQANLPPLPERRTERRASAVASKQEKVAKPKYGPCPNIYLA